VIPQPVDVELDCAPLSAASQVREGMTLYTRGGTQYEFDRILSDTEWLVYPLLEHPTWDGEMEVYADDRPVIMPPGLLFPKAPKPLVEKTVGEADNRLQDLNRQILAKRAELAQFEREEAERRLRIARHEGLARLDDWVSGKITHVVRLHRNEAHRVVPIADLADDDRYDRVKALKLLTLWGKTNGDLNWRLSAYSDGSGNDIEVVPFSSEDDALAHVKGLVESAWEAFRAGDFTVLRQALLTVKAHGFSVPDDVEEHLRKVRIKDAETSVLKLRDAFETAAITLAQARRS
jgi:hypothetical protein